MRCPVCNATQWKLSCSTPAQTPGCPHCSSTQSHFTEGTNVSLPGSVAAPRPTHCCLSATEWTHFPLCFLLCWKGNFYLLQSPLRAACTGPRSPQMCACDTVPSTAAKGVCLSPLLIWGCLWQSFSCYIHVQKKVKVNERMHKSVNRRDFSSKVCRT